MYTSSPTKILVNKMFSNEEEEEKRQKQMK